MHNDMLADFPRVKRDLAMAVEPALFPEIEGSTDSEMFFFLALTFGLDRDPVAGVERAVGFIEQACRKHDIQEPMRMSVATSDGESIWAFRYSTVGDPPSLFYSTKVETIRHLYPDLAGLQKLSDEARLVVSEPLGDLQGVWNEVPPSSCGVIRGGQDELRPFVPRNA